MHDRKLYSIFIGKLDISNKEILGVCHFRAEEMKNARARIYSLGILFVALLLIQRLKTVIPSHFVFNY